MEDTVVYSKQEKLKRLRAWRKKEKKKAKKEHKKKVHNVFTVDLFFYQPCIYFLKKGNDVVYIGETTSLMQRISQHVNDGKKDFDSFSFYGFSGSDMQRKAKEKSLIDRMKPMYNIVHKKQCVKLVFGANNI